MAWGEGIPAHDFVLSGINTPNGKPMCLRCSRGEASHLGRTRYPGQEIRGWQEPFPVDAAGFETLVQLAFPRPTSGFDTQKRQPKFTCTLLRLPTCSTDLDLPTPGSVVDPLVWQVTIIE